MNASSGVSWATGKRDSGRGPAEGVCHDGIGSADRKRGGGVRRDGIARPQQPPGRERRDATPRARGCRQRGVRALDRAARSSRVDIGLGVPLVGLGAPAATYYPAIGELLGAPVTVPADADVANAIGAVVADVRVRHEVLVTAPRRGVYRVHVGSEPETSWERPDAEARAREAAETAVRIKAAEAGTIDFEIETEWTEKVIDVDNEPHPEWPIPVPGVMSAILVSMDDRYLYLNNWLHGDIRQYDISDPHNPQLTGQVWMGGLLNRAPTVNGHRITGGPQMIQLSLDGKRLYVTTSLFSTWDNQFYPDIRENGGCMVMVNCDTENGGMEIDADFFVDFGKEPNGPARCHETRYPGGDCTSDIFL